MNIVLKNSLKNIFGKPLRTLLVVFSIFVCSVCAMLCFDLVSSIEKYVTMVFGNISSGDIIALVDDYSIKGLPEGFPECDVMEINSNRDTLYRDIEGEYAFVSTTQINIYGIEVDDAVATGFIDPIELGDMETYISYKLSKEFGYKAGDTIVVHDRAGEEVTLNITGVIPKDNKNTLIAGYKLLVNLDTAKVISCGRGDVGVLMIDILDDDRIVEADGMLQEYYPEGTVVRIALTDDESASIQETAAVFYLIFAIAFLLVIFVTASICNRIVSERMPMIGTLRSFGMSSARTARVLLLENVLYALLGSVPAVVFYALIKKPLFNMIFYVSDSDGNAVPMAVDPVSWILIASVIAGAVLVECLIPLKAILKAIKTPIRDIIFDNRDTEYKYSKAGLALGLILLAGAVVAFFFRQQFSGATICLLCAVIALAFIFPWIYKLIVTGLINLADKKGNAAWGLALTEAKTRKSTVSSGVLCVTAAAMSVIIFGIAMSALDMYSGYDFSSDVIVYCTGKTKDYEFIDKLDGVTDTEAIYRESTGIKVNDIEPSIITGLYGDFLAMPDDGFKYYNFFAELPDSLEEGSVLVDDHFAEKYGIKQGDTVKIVYDPDGVVPITREYNVQDLVKIRSFDGQTGTFIITKTEFKAIFRDTISYYLVKCDDPDKISRMITTYAVGAYSDTQTYEEYKELADSDRFRLTAILMTVIAVGLGMTFVGMVSNQLIGFDGRKKECAVMLSTSMGRKKLSGILVKEMLITSALASVAGTLTGLILCKVIDAAMQNSQLYMPVNPDLLKCLIFCIVLILVFTGTVLFPLKHLRKMKLSETLKYE